MRVRRSCTFMADAGFNEGFFSVGFYGEKDFKENSHQLATAERWLKAIEDSSVLLLTPARISLKNELMEKAENYY